MSALLNANYVEVNTGVVSARDDNAGNQDWLLKVNDLRTHFYLSEGVVRAVDGVSFSLQRGRTLGIIGESGCGKSVTAHSILRLVPSPPGRLVSGEILFRTPSDATAKTSSSVHSSNDIGADDAIDLAKLDPKGAHIRRIRGRHIGMIFQEPMTSFGPMHTIGNQIMESIRIHEPDVTGKAAKERVAGLLARVGIPQPHRTIDAYPHQLSGGMRQRAMIAMALACTPSLLIADEPTTALDVTIQAQILDLLRRLQQEYGMAVMFITHNLGVIAEIADEVAVMYLGRIVEHASVDEIFDHPKHPYTQALLRSIPRIDRKAGRRLPTIEGMVPDPFDFPSGCPFSDRCEHFMADICDRAVPALTNLAETAERRRKHFVRCYLYSDADDEAHGGSRHG